MVFKKVENEDVDQQFRINIHFREDSFNLSIWEKSNAWEAEVSRNDISQFADQFELTSKEYYLTLKCYLEATPANVDLKLKNEEFICYCKENGINVKYFSCQLQKTVFNESLYELLDKFSSEKESLEQENLELIKVKRDTQKACAELKLKLVEFLDTKTKDERELLSNFVLVLNEKKRRIQHLNQTLHAFKASRPVLNPQIKWKKRSKKDVKKESNQVSESESGDDGDYNTDKEDSNKEENPKFIPNTSKNDDCASLFSDSDDIIDLPKRRKANQSDNDTPSTSKIEDKRVPEASDDSDVEDIKKVPKASDDNDVNEHSPTITFNTQDLLDCI